MGAMCSFLFVAVSKRVALERAGELRVRAIDGTRVPSAVPNDHRAYFVTDAQCSCAFEVRPAQPDRAQHYRRKGWSETKIARALQQARDASAVDPTQAPGLRNDVRAFLQSALQRSGALYVCLFVTTANPVDDIPTTVVRANMSDILALRVREEAIAFTTT
jgi:hypothetical protein